MSFQLDPPRVQPPLDENFRPAILANQNFQREVESIGARLVLGLDRSGSEFSRFKLDESNGLSYALQRRILLCLQGFYPTLCAGCQSSYSQDELKLS